MTVYCQKCRFLRYQMEDGKVVQQRGWFNIFRQDDDDDNITPTYCCVAPKNITDRKSWLKHLGPCYKRDPGQKNKDNDCPDYETVDQAVAPRKELPLYESQNETVAS